MKKLKEEKKGKILNKINKIENILLVLSVLVCIYLIFFLDRADGKQILPYERKEDYPIFSGENVYEYWRGTLTREEQVIYDDMKEGFLQFRTSISPRTKYLSNKMLSETYAAFLQDHPEIFWKNSYRVASRYFDSEQVNTSKKITLEYLYSKEGAISLNETMKQKYEPIIQEAQKQEEDLEKIRYVHNALIELAHYQKYTAEEINEYQSIVSLFRDGNTVCAGYSYAFKMIMDRLGIECIIARDISHEDTSKNHSWNLVRYNGIWYNVDVTWDGDQEKNEKDPYQYFMQSHKRFYKTHKKLKNLPENPK